MHVASVVRADSGCPARVMRTYCLVEAVTSALGISLWRHTAWADFTSPRNRHSDSNNLAFAAMMAAHPAREVATFYLPAFGAV